MLRKVDILALAPVQLLKLVKKAGGQRAFAREHGIPRTTLQERLYKLRVEPFTHRPAPKAKRVGDRKGVRRFILSSAQDSTVLHEEFLTNLEAYCGWLQQSGSCEILIGGFTYNKSLFEDHSKSGGTWPTRIAPYLVSDRIRIADKIDFCGEMNTLPTAENPLSGFHTYTSDRWGVFPHAKVQLVSVPTMKHLPSKQIMTTGAVTKPNYVMKKAGIKASFHHVYGAVLVEIDQDGDFFCRHLIADDAGDFYDLDRLVKDGEVTTGHRVEVLTPGDVHVAQIDPVASRTIFGIWPGEPAYETANPPRVWRSDQETPSILDALNPKHVFLHDASDFRARNHHNILDPHDRFRMHVNGVESVEGELAEVALVLTELSERYTDSHFYVVDSNHDQALLRWLKYTDYRNDPANALFFLKCQLAQYEAIQNGGADFSILRHVMQNFYPNWKCADVTFLQEDKTPVVIGGVEHSNHGHRGPNGSRGSVASLMRVASKMTIGHVHSPAILDGLYAAGTTSLMDLGYNAGPSSWAHTLVVQYANGKRALITLRDGKWKVD